MKVSPLLGNNRQCSSKSEESSEYEVRWWVIIWEKYAAFWLKLCILDVTFPFFSLNKNTF